MPGYGAWQSDVPPGVGDCTHQQLIAGSGAPLSLYYLHRMCAMWAAAGSTPSPMTITGTGGTTKATGVLYVLKVPDIFRTQNAWSAGNWTMRLHVSVGKFQVKLSDIFIQQFDANCNRRMTIASLTGQSLAMFAGSYQWVLAGVLPSAPLLGDFVVVQFVFKVSRTGNYSITVLPDKYMPSPFYEPLPLAKPVTAGKVGTRMKTVVAA